MEHHHPCRTRVVGAVIGADCPDCGHANVLHSYSKPCVACEIIYRFAQSPLFRGVTDVAEGKIARLDWLTEEASDD